MAFDRRTLILPADTVFEEHTIVTRGDVVVADNTEVTFGLKTDARIFVGERVRIGGDVTAEDEVRVDLFSTIDGDVTAKGAVYLGEKCHVKGKLFVDGDLDVGDDVTIEEGFEARGWINIRSPIPLIIYLFIYLMQLLQQGESAEVQRIIDELTKNEKKVHISEIFLFVPPGSSLGLQESVVKGHMSVGSGCRILGNFTVEGNVHLGEGAIVFGAVRAKGQCTLEPKAVIEGDLAAGGQVSLDGDARVLGDLTADKVEMHHSAVVGGTLRAPGGIKFVTPAVREMDEKIERFKRDAPEGIGEMLG